jgi:hypothetical protein
MGVNASQGAASVTEAEFTASVTPVAGAFAEAFDLAWFATSRTPNQYDVESISEACNDAWIGRQPANNPTTLLAITWMVEAVTLVNLVISGDDYMTGQGITPTPIPGSNAGSEGYVIFRPGVASTGNAVATWAEVQTALYNPATGLGARVIYVDSSHAAAQVPAGSTTNLQGFIELRAFTQGSEFEELTIEDTALIQNPCRFGTGLSVTVECLTSPAFAFTIASEDPVLVFEVFSFLQNVAGSTVEAYKVPNGDSLDIFCFGGVIDGESAHDVGVFGAADGGGLLVAAFDGSAFTPTSFDSAAGGEFLFEYDSSVVPEQWSLLAGTTVQEGVDLYTNLNGGAYVIYRPGGIASGNVATTFAQLQAAVNAGAMMIYVDSSLGAASIPAGETLTPPTGGVIQLVSFNGTSASDALTVADTGVIQDLTLIDGGLSLQCTCTTSPALTYSRPGTFLLLRGGSSAIVILGAGSPAVSVGAGQELFVSINNVSEVLGVAGFPFAKATGGTILMLAFGFSTVNAQAIGQSAGTAEFFFDSSCTPPVFTVGAVTLVAIDLVANLKPSVTTTVGRPTVNLQPGQQSFDSTLGIPIWRNAGNTAWVNSAGAPV